MESEKGKISVREAGQRGGRRTRETHGHEFYQSIGQKGGETTSREHGPEFYHEIGTKGGHRVRDLINEGKGQERR